MTTHGSRVVKIRLSQVVNFRLSLRTFDDPVIRLPAIDRLEGFYPGGPCLYRRVLVPILVNGAVLPAWLYVGENSMSRRFTPLGESRWPR